jgi:hypothetical protein
MSNPSARHDRWMVRHRQIETKQAHDRADQIFRLAQREPKHRPQRQRRDDGQPRIPGLAASAGSRLSPPSGDRFLAEPNCQIAALAQARLIGGWLRWIPRVDRGGAVGAGFIGTTEHWFDMRLIHADRTPIPASAVCRPQVRLPHWRGDLDRSEVA